MISEVFKQIGFDGILYKSLLGSGHNYALFDLNSANLVSCTLCRACNVSFEFEIRRERYVVDGPEIGIELNAIRVIPRKVSTEQQRRSIRFYAPSHDLTILKLSVLRAVLIIGSGGSYLFTAYRSFSSSSSVHLAPSSTSTGLKVSSKSAK